MKNGDRIRAMTDNDLANLFEQINDFSCTACCSNLDRCRRNNAPEPVSCKRHYMEWLNEETEQFAVQLPPELTVDDLKEMHGEPVWREQDGYDGRWVLVDVFLKREGVIYLANVHGSHELVEIALKEGVKLYRSKPKAQNACISGEMAGGYADQDVLAPAT